MKEKRIIQSSIGEVIPLVDIAKQIGYSDSALRKIIRKQEKQFHGEKVLTPIPTSRGLQKAWCLTHKGMEKLILLISPGSGEKAPLLEKRVENFHMGTSTSGDPIADSLRRNAIRKTILIEEWGYDPAIARKLAMELVVLETGDAGRILKGPATTPKLLSLPAPTSEQVPVCKDCIMTEADPDFDKYFGIEKVASLCGITRNQAQNILEKQNIIVNRIGIFHLTRLGESINAGKVFTHYPLAPHRMTPNKMIRYSPIAIERIRAALNAQQAPLIPGEALAVAEVK